MFLLITNVQGLCWFSADGNETTWKCNLSLNTEKKEGKRQRSAHSVLWKVKFFLFLPDKTSKTVFFSKTV